MEAELYMHRVVKQRLADRHMAEQGEKVFPANRAKLEPIIDKQFSDMDGVFKKIYNYIPNVSSEMLYRTELNQTLRIFGFLMFVGVLMILAVLLYSVNW